jgi:hypothetical protein
MKATIRTPRFFFISIIILVAAISRVFPHIPNFTPIAAMALAGGVYLTDKRLAFIIPLLALFISDCLLEATTGWGFHNTMIYVYVAFALTTCIGIYIKNKVSVQNIAAASLFSSVLFFVISNFGVWAANGMQAGITGLGTTYVLGIPFFGPTMVGDLFFNTILFSVFYFAQRRFPALQRIK